MRIGHLFAEKKSLSHKKKIAFVASGGAVKAACFHVGVCLALQEKGFHFAGGLKNYKDYVPSQSPAPTIDSYIGSSAGAIVTTLLASGYTLPQIMNSFTKVSPLPEEEKPIPRLRYYNIFHPTPPSLFNPFKKDKKNRRLWGAIKGHYFLKGLFCTKGIEKFFRTKILPTQNFDDLAASLYIVATQLDYSQKTVFGKKRGYSEEHSCFYTNDVSISEAVAASVALPPLFVPYRIIHQNRESLYYFDGEIRQTLSTHIAKDIGADLIIASYTHQPYHYTPEMGSLMEHGISYIAIQALYQCIEQKIQTAKTIHDNKKLVIDGVTEFFKNERLPRKKLDDLIEILEKKMEYRRELDYIFIHPQPHDHDMFFGDHFNLSAKSMDAAVRIGFRSAINALRHYEI